MMCRLLWLVTLLIAARPAFADGRVALVVGVSNYESRALQPLPNAIADAQAIGTKLRSLGFDTDIVLEPTRDDLRRALSSLFRRRQTAKADTALIYFAGHGLQAETERFLLARDSDLAPRSVLERNQEVSMTNLLQRVREAKLAILLFDACRNTPSLARTLEKQTRDTLSAGLPSIGDRVGIQAVISYSTLPNARAFDAVGNNPNSPYAEGLLDYLGRPHVELAEMLRGVDRFVESLTERAQRPTFEDRRGPGSAFYFRPVSLEQPSSPNVPLPTIMPLPGQVSAPEALALLTGKTGATRASALAGLLAQPGLLGPIAPETALALLGDVPDDAGRRRRSLDAMLPLMDLPIDPRAAQRLLAGLSEISRLAALSNMLGCLARPVPDDQAQALVDGIPRDDIPRLFRQLTMPTVAGRCGS